MKKSKLLMLSTIAPVSLVLPMVATSCNKGETGEFICEGSSQVTIRGEIACWYVFDYDGSQDIPDDIEVRLATETDQLNSQLLCQIIEAKKIKVGVQGVRSKLKEDGEVIPFAIEFKSKKLGIKGQSVDCKYKYLESKVRAFSPKVEERDNTIENFRVDAVFEFTDSIEIDKLSIQFDNYHASDEEKIGIPERDGEFVDVTGKIQQAIKVEKTGPWTDGDWVQFDVHFKYENGENSWEQVIPGYTYQVSPISYVIDDLTKKCDIQIDIKGNTVKGLKAVVDDSDVGVLPIGTAINSPFKMTFDKSKSPEEWPDNYVRFYKFGSFVNPNKYSGGYHKYASVVVELVKSNDEIVQLTQTYTGDREGQFGAWWISTGGPITVIRSKIDEIDTNWKSLIFKLRTAQEIEKDSSFYITYSDK